MTDGTSRRTMLKQGGALAGAAALIGGSQLLGGNALVSAASKAERQFQFDVAMDGHSLKINRGAVLTPDAPFIAGDTFMVRGRIFPEGTAAQGLSGPAQEGSIGTWICFGTFLYSFAEIGEGAVPHVLTTQYFLLDSGDGLFTEGTEGGIYTLRTVFGGYGAHKGATGQVGEREVGVNDTLRAITSEISVPTPNLTFDFDLLP